MRILLVEDYPGFAEAASAALDMRGFPVTDLATTGIEAVELLANADYDAVITDYELPGVYGPGVAAVALSHDTPLVVLWSSIPRDDEMRGDPLMDDPRFHLAEKDEVTRVVGLLAHLTGLLKEETDG